MTSSPQPLSFDLSGKILRKKKTSAEYLKLAIQADGDERSTAVYIPRNEPVCNPSEFNFLYLGAIIRVRGNIGGDEAYHHVSQCDLLTCAPNVTLIKEILALPNPTSFASAVGMGEEELRQSIEEDTQKAVVHGIIERITGKRAKAPPKYRPGRIKRSDMEILERKEAEGKVDGFALDPLGWTLCQPCRPPETAPSVNVKREAVVNLPDGADDSISAHGKLTRSEYLETKKNRQAAWFVERIKRFECPPRRFLDVGGGRGDLAVQIALHFPEARVVVVDSNESSVLAGREYAAKCGVEWRVEFRCTNFAQFTDEYDSGIGERVDFVLALHACGDLSDAALSFASSNGCDFVICPCCYPKRYLAPFLPGWRLRCSPAEADVLSRLAEQDDHREVSRRAAIVVNSMRRSAFEGRGEDVGLEEFDGRMSRRNVALVGTGLRPSRG